MLQSTVCYAALLAMLLFVSVPVQAQLITNGGFETPVVSSGGFQLYSTGSSFDGWTVVGASGNNAVASGSYTSGGFSFPAQEGVQWLDLTGDSNSATGVQQTVATNVGKDYELSFWVGNIVGNVFGTTSTVEVFVGGVSLGTFANLNGAGTNTLEWQQFSLDFTASNTSTAIEFLNRDPSTDGSNGLDNVNLVAVNSAVTPEPGRIVLLMGTAVFGGSLLLRCRRK